MIASYRLLSRIFQSLLSQFEKERFFYRKSKNKHKIVLDK